MGALKSAGERQESATFLHAAFSMLQCSHVFCCSKAFGKNDVRCRKANVSVQLLQRNFQEFAAQLLLSLVAYCSGGV